MKFTRLAASIAALGLVFSAPSYASIKPADASKIRKLDIMLMVTSLRCRHSRQDFTGKYARFTRRHMGTLNLAARTLKSQFARRHGARGGKRAMDRISVRLANNYGRGHPWLSCKELGKVAKNLSKAKGGSALVKASDELLAKRRSRRFAYAR